MNTQTHTAAMDQRVRNYHQDLNTLMEKRLGTLIRQYIEQRKTPPPTPA
ncbi:hypothetical protein KKF84_17375 [Myxococcota bacterium]|nr:hypothetical protein [Myxococcota bacterium]